MKLTLDGGATFITIENADMVKVVYEDVPVPGEAQSGTLTISLTNSAVLTDVYVPREGDEEVMIGFLSEMVDRIIHRAVADTADQKARHGQPETLNCSVIFTVPVVAEDMKDAAELALTQLRDRTAGPWSAAVSKGRHWSLVQVGEQFSSLAGEGAWARVCTKQGWDQDTQVTILEGFVRQQGLFGQLAQYAERHADEENGVDPFNFLFGSAPPIN